MTGRFEPTNRTTARRLPKRAAYDRKTVHAILDAGLVAHVGFVQDGQPFVLPLIYGRVGDELYLHGSAGGRALRALKSGSPLCLTVTHLDGLVMARSAFNHSMNYRCVVVLGPGRLVDSPRERLAALKAISDHLFPGRWEDARKPNKAELAQTTVVALTLAECSAKVRGGPPIDESGDYELDVWAGVIPARTVFEEAIHDPKLKAGISFPSYLSRFRPRDAD